jgi:hypothetical protein
MPRILPPPTKYDPLRPVQAKAASPAALKVVIPPTRFDPPVQHAGPAGTIQRATGGGGPAARSFAIPPTRYDPGVRHQTANVVQRAAAAGGGGGSGAGQPPRKPVPADSKAFYKTAAGKPVYGAASGAAGGKFDGPPPGKADYQSPAAASGKSGQSQSAAAGGKHRGGNHGHNWGPAGGHHSHFATAGDFDYRSAGRGRGGRGRGGGRGGGSSRPATAAGTTAAAGEAAAAKPPKSRPDTMMEAFARKLTKGDADGFLGQPGALIGTDKATHSPLYEQFIKQAADCLAIWLVHEEGEPHTNVKNLAWLDRCIGAGKSFFVVKPGDHGVGSFAVPLTATEVKAAKPIQTVHEIGYLMHKGYKWDDVNTFNPPK